MPKSDEVRVSTTEDALAGGESASRADPTPAVTTLFRGGKIPLSARIVSVASNPKRAGSKARARYDLYPEEGSTIEQILAIKDGPTRADILYDVRKGHLVLDTLGEEAEEPEEEEEQQDEEEEDQEEQSPPPPPPPAAPRPSPAAARRR